MLRQGLKRERVDLVVVFCALADALLMTAGVLGAAQPAFVIGACTADALWFTALG